MQIPLISSSHFLDMYILQNRLSFVQFDDFTPAHESETKAINFAESYGIDLMPYMFVLSCCNKQMFRHFNKFLASYLDDFEDVDVYMRMTQDIETLICCILCMQYYFI